VGLDQNVAMRKVLLGAAISAAAFVIATVIAVGVDFGTSIYAEYQLSVTVRRATQLHSDPFVAILGFPFIPQAVDGHYEDVEIKASAVDHAVVGRATLEATMHSVGLTDTSWLISPQAKLPVGKLESRIIIDSVHLGRYLGISDLMVEAPPQDTNDATGGTTESGISGSHGLVFTGTPKSAKFDKRVSVSVDLSMAGSDRSTLMLTPTGILTGPDTADQRVPTDKRDAVLAAFRQSVPQQRLPFGAAPTSQGARGSDVIIEGITRGVIISLDEFKQS
jgi:LmeA-like phospholipid-binding